MSHTDQQNVCKVVSGYAAALSQAAQAQDIGSFDPFVVDDLSAPKSVATVKDPTGQAPMARVNSFKIPPAYCNNRPYDKSGKDSDRTWKSTRSQIRENVFATKKNGTAQPKQSWYDCAPTSKSLTSKSWSANGPSLKFL